MQWWYQALSTTLYARLSERQQDPGPEIILSSSVYWVITGFTLLPVGKVEL